MSAITKLRQARNAEQMAAEIEPLAQSLAALADETRQSLAEMQETSHKQAIAWGQQQQKAAEALKSAGSSIEAAAQRLKAQAEASTDGLMWRFLAVAILTGAAAGGLTTGFWLWVQPPPPIQNQLDPQAMAEYLKPALVEALKKGSK
jgi:hypothetical protein